MNAEFKTCIGFQTIKKEFHKNVFPHYAKSDLKTEPSYYQWLSDGYYFWMNSDIYAHFWGKRKCNGNYVINKYHISILRENILDLTENPTDEKFFSSVLSKYIKMYEESIKAGKTMPEPTVSTVIHFLRINVPKLFKYHAISISDRFLSKKISYPYEHGGLKMTPDSEFNCDYYGDMGRPQLCIFKGFESSFEYIQTTIFP